jgi:hypothetical protein
MKKFLKKLSVFFLLFLLTAQTTLAVDSPNYWKKVGNNITLINPAWTLAVTPSFSGDQVFDGAVTIDETDTEALLVRRDGDTGDIFNVNTTNAVTKAYGTVTFQGVNFNVNKVDDPQAAPTTALNSPAAAGNVDNGDYTYKVTFASSTAGRETLPGPASSVVTVADNSVNGKTKLTNIPQPVNAPDFDNINIYRDKDDAQFWQFVAAVPVGTTTYVDNIDQATVDGTGQLPSPSNLTGNANFNGVLTANDSAIFNNTALFAFGGSSNNAIINGPGNDILFPWLEIRPTQSASQDIGLWIVPDGSDYTSDLILLNERHSGGSSPVVRFDDYGNMISADGGTYSQPALGNVDVKALHNGMNYGVRTAQGVPSFFGQLVEFGQSTGGISASKFQIGQDSAQAMRMNVPNGTGFIFSHNGVDTVTMRGQSPMIIAQQARSGNGAAKLLTATGAAHSNWNASGGPEDVVFDLARTVQFNAAQSEINAFKVTAPTYSYTSAQTTSDASTFTVTGAPIAGTNATLTRSMAMWVKSGLARFDGNLQASAKIAAGGDASIGNGRYFDLSQTATDFTSTYSGATGSTQNSMVKSIYTVDPSANISSGTFVASSYNSSHVPSSNNKNIYSLFGNSGELVNEGSGTLHQGSAGDFEAYNAGNGTASFLSGVNGIAINSGAGNVVWNTGAYFIAGASGGSTTDNYGAYIDSGFGTATTNTGLYVASQTSGTTNRAIKTNLGPVEIGDRILGKSVSVASANDLTLGAGNQNIVSGTTTINAITTANWTAGSRVTLIFSGALTVKHNTAGGAGTAKIFLAGSADLSTAANTVLVLEYDGTQWQEVSRKAA